MKTNITQHTLRLLRHLSAGALALGLTATALAQGTAFTYQGRLVEGGQPASGLYALHFTLWDEATRGLRLGEPQIDDRVVVSNGLFTVTLDFGARPPYFTGDARWLEIAVDHYHSTNYVTLAPRQPLTPTPYAMFAPAAGSVPASGLTGTVPDARLSANVALLNSSPTFTGTVQAAQVQGGGAGLTGVIPADNSVTSIKIVDNAVAAVDLASEVASLHKVSGGHLTVDADGNVGLGMSTPGVPLNFAHEIGDKISLYGTGTNHYGLGIQAGLLQIHGSTASADIAFGYGSSTNFTEQMRIQGTGNVGVNKPNPSTTLDVNGTVTATAFVGPGAGLTGITPADNSVTSAKILNGAILNADLADNSVNAAKIADGSVTSLKIADNAVAAVDLASEEGSLNKVSGGHLTVTPAGNLGLGLAAPIYPLDVRAEEAVGRFLSTSISSVSFLELGNTVPAASFLGAINFSTSSGTPPGQIAYDRTDGLTFRAGLAERLRITPAGNLGLGVSTPNYPLNFASTTGDKISLYGTGTNHYGFGIQSSLLQIHGSAASTAIAFGYGSSANFTEQMRIQGNGNVGIGTNQPQTALHVAGTVTAERFATTSASGNEPPSGVTPILNMVWIKPGTFIMGSSAGEPGRAADEGPQRTVTLTKGFWMGHHEVTQGEYQSLMNTNPSYFTGDLSRPVETVSWIEATNFCGVLTQRELAAERLPAGWAYRLPTEAEWEYCCRALTTTRFSYGDDLIYTSLTDYAWYSENSGSTTHPVGQKLANAWGLVDMSGNVSEWCRDWYGSTYSGTSVTDPLGPSSGSARVIRSGAWSIIAGYCRSAFRYDNYPTYRYNNLGFRVVLAPGQ